jgi:hypothetical protein
VHRREHLVPKLGWKNEAGSLDALVSQLTEEERSVPEALKRLVAEGYPHPVGAPVGRLLVRNVFGHI